MTDGSSPPRSEPGDARPRQLDRAPGERYGAPAAARLRIAVEHPDMRRAALLGAAAALATIAAVALLRGILDLSAGIMAVAAVGGAGIGAAVRSGAWGRRPHRHSMAPVRLAVALAALTWIGGLVASWLVAMAILPASSRTLGERISDTPFLDWVAPQLSALDLVELALLVGTAWYVARSAARDLVD